VTSIQPPIFQFFAPHTERAIEQIIPACAWRAAYLQQLTDLANERAGIEESLRDMKEKDNILPKIMAAAESYDTLFAREIAKYDGIKADVEANVQRSQQLLGQIAAANQKFRRVLSCVMHHA
jgi:hypothetical protein